MAVEFGIFFFFIFFFFWYGPEFSGGHRILGSESCCSISASKGENWTLDEQGLDMELLQFSTIDLALFLNEMDVTVLWCRKPDFDQPFMSLLGF
ncbi:hypothetical protein VTK26DRAFT_95 [Humicola hyalothermophila]